MTSITILLDPATEARLRQISDETGRSCEDLAESALSEETLTYFRHREDDPARGLNPWPVASSRVVGASL